MEDLLVALLEFLLELLLEVALQAAAEGLFAMLFTAIAEVFSPEEFRQPLVASIGYLLLGSATGGLSLIWFPFPLVHPSRFHGISLIISPVITGSAMALLGSILRGRGKRTINLESFGYGFVFALGMAIIRFIFAR